jgi:molybdenum cofactor cytidylyltransferase
MKTGGIGGLVLAAGMGSRMGTPKLRLMKGPESFLRCCVRALLAGGADVVVSVVSAEDSAWAAVEVPEAQITVNEVRSEEMLASVRVGIQALAHCDGVVILPVDHPHVNASTVRALLEAGRSEDNVVVKPTYRGHAGHPIVIPRLLYPSVLAAKQGDTLRALIASSGIAVRRLEVPDPAVLKNLNTREDLSALSQSENL